jgi:gas vesicle protein
MFDSGHRGAFVVGVLVGAVGGALSALLMTPKSGQDIREQIKGQTAPVQDRLSSATSTVRERTAGVQDRLTTATSGVLERADDVIDASKGKVTQLTQRGQETEDQVVPSSKLGVSEPIAGDAQVHPTASSATTPPEAVARQEPASPGEG